MSSQDGRCGFYVKRKHRFCKMLPAKGNKYCAEHLSEDKEYQGDLTRVQCPLDPKHSVFKHKLEKHLKKCNAVRKTQEVYYEEGINAGIISYEYPEEEKIPLTSVPGNELMDLIKRLKDCYQSIKESIDESFDEHQVLADEIRKEEFGPTTKKHLRQQASLLTLLERNGALQNDSCIIEFGAGRGKLMHWVQKAMDADSKGHFYLIDRENNRHKFDCYHKGADQGSPFHRLYIDIKDLNLDRVDGLQGHSITTGLGKHLCGAATDFSIRCLLDQDRFSPSDAGNGLFHNSRCHRLLLSPSVRPPEKKLKTINNASLQPDLVLIALCCHHRCTWPSYVGRDLFVKHGFSSLDFHRLTALTSWALCGFREKDHDDSEISHDEDDAKNKESVQSENKIALNGDNANSKPVEEQGARTLSKDAKEEIGRMAKRLIDYGRLDYIRHCGYSAQLIYYVPKDITPENIVLLAKRSSSQNQSI